MNHYTHIKNSKIFSSFAKRFTILLALLTLCSTSWTADYTWDGTSQGTVIFEDGDNLTVTADTTVDVLAITGTVTVNMDSGVTLTVETDTHLGYDGVGGKLILKTGTLVTNELQSNTPTNGVLEILSGATVDVTEFVNSFDEGMLTITGDGNIDLTGTGQSEGGSGTVNKNSFTGTITEGPTIYTWVGGNSGQWKNQQNWDCDGNSNDGDDGYPETNDIVIFTGNDVVTVKIEDTRSVSEIRTNTEGDSLITINITNNHKLNVNTTTLGTTDKTGNFSFTGSGSLVTKELTSNGTENDKQAQLTVDSATFVVTDNVTADGINGIKGIVTNNGTIIVPEGATHITGNFTQVATGSFVWTGTYNTQWTVVQNWLGGSVPAQNGTNPVPILITKKTNSPVIESNQTIELPYSTITFEDGASLSANNSNASFKVGDIIAEGDVSLSGNINTESGSGGCTGTQTYNGTITLTGDTKLIAEGTITLNGATGEDLTVTSSNIELNGTFNNTNLKIGTTETTTKTTITTTSTTTSINNIEIDRPTEIMVKDGKNLTINQKLLVNSPTIVYKDKDENANVTIPAGGAYALDPVTETPDIHFYELDSGGNTTTTRFDPETTTGDSPYKATWVKNSDTEVKVTIIVTETTAYNQSFKYYINSPLGTTASGTLTILSTGSDSNKFDITVSNANTDTITLRTPCDSLVVSTYNATTPTDSIAWTGDVNKEWNNTQNWSNLPAGTTTLETVLQDEAIIIYSSATNQPTISTATTVESLTIESGAELTIADGANLTLNTLKVNGTVTSTTGTTGTITFTGENASLTDTSTSPTSNTYGNVIIADTATGFEVGIPLKATSFTTNAAITISGGEITTTGDQTYGGTVVLDNQTDLTTTDTDSTVIFNGTIDSNTSANHGLNVKTNTIEFNGIIGDTKELYGLGAWANTIEINTDTISTQYMQVYQGAVTFLQDATLRTTKTTDDSSDDSNKIEFKSTVNSDHDITLSAGGGAHEIIFTDDITGSPNSSVPNITISNAEKLTIKANLSATNLTFPNSATNLVFDPILSTGQTIGVKENAFSTITGTITKTANPTTFTNGFTQASGGGTVKLQGSVIATTGNLSFTGTTRLTADTTLEANSTNGEIIFENTVDGSSASAELAITSAIIKLNGSTITTTGAQTYTGAVTLGVDTTLDAGAANILFSSTVTGGSHNLTISESKTTTFSKEITGINTLTVKATGNETDDYIALEGNVQVTNINFDAPKVRFNKADDTTEKTIDITNWPITFNGELYINTTYHNTIKFTNSTDKTINATKIYLRGNITTNNNLTFNAPTALISSVIITAGTNDITFENTLDSQGLTNQNALTIASANIATFTGAVGSNQSLTGFDITASEIKIDGGSVTTNEKADNSSTTEDETTVGIQIYNGNVNLGANTTLTAKKTSLPGNSITFKGNISGSKTLTLDAESLIFDSASDQTVDVSTELIFAGKVIKSQVNTLTFKNGFSQTGTGAVSLVGEIIATNGNLSFTGETELTGNTTLEANTANGEVVFTNTINGSHVLTVTNAKITTFADAITEATELSITTKTLAFNADTSQNAQDSVIEGPANLEALSISFGNHVNDSFSSTTLNFTGTPTVELAGMLTTSNAIEFPGNVTIGQDSTVNSTNTNITFNGNLTGTGTKTLSLDAGSASIFLNAGADGQDTNITGAVTLTAANSISFGNHEEDTISFGSFDITTGTLNLGGTIATTGSQTYTCDIILVVKTNISSGANVTFNGTINSDEHGFWDLSIYGNPSGNAGTVTFGGAVGTGTVNIQKLGILDVEASSIAINGGIINTTGNQTYSSNITSTGAIELDADTSTIALNGDLVTTPGTQTYKSAVTGDGDITFNATTINIDGGAITTNGSQTYDGNVVLGGTTTLTTTHSGVHFESDVGGNKNLTIDTGTATTSVIDFKANVTINEADFTATDLNFHGSTAGNTVNITSGLNTYTGNITINDSNTIDPQKITFTNGFTQNSTTPGSVYIQDTINAANSNFSFEGPTTLIGETIIDAGTGTLIFDNTIISDNIAQRSLSTKSSSATFNKAIGSNTSGEELNNFSVEATNIYLNSGFIKTKEAQIYTGSVELGADTTLNSGAGNITFTSTVGGAFNLETTNSDTTIFADAITDVTALSITTETLAFNADTSQDAQTSVIDGSAILEATSISFGNNENDSFTSTTLSFTGTSSIELAGTLAITTSASAITFPSPVTLIKNTTVTTKNGAITFNGTVTQSTHTLTVNAGSGAIAFNENITGSGNLTINETAGSGTVSFTGGSTSTGALTIRTSGNVTFGNTDTDSTSFGSLAWDRLTPKVTLAGTLKTTSTTPNDSAITLPSSVKLAQNATIETHGDNITVTGNITNTTAKNLTLKNANKITFNGKLGTDGTTKKDLGTIIVSSDTGIATKATFNDELYADSLDISATAIAFNAKTPATAEETIITGAATLTTYIGAIPSGSISFGNDAEDTVSFGSFTIKTDTLNLGGTIATTAGGQVYDCNIILVANTILSTKTDTDVDFKGTINNDDKGPWTLDIFGSTSAAEAGNVTFGEEVGTAKQIESLDILSDIITMNGATIETTGNQNYYGDITLGVNTTLLADSGNLFFRNKIQGDNTLELTANGTATDGEIEFKDPVTITSLEANASIIKINTSSLTTTGLQTYKGKVETGTNTLTISSTASGKVTFEDTLTLKAKTTVKSNGEIQFDDAINGAKVFAVTGNPEAASKITFTGTVGNSEPLTDLSATATAINLNGGEVTTTGAQTYTGAVVLGGIPTATTFTTTNSDILFNSTINGNDTVTVNAGTGDVTYENKIGEPTKLTSLSTAAGTIQLNAGTVKTTGNQTYNGNTLLGKNTTIDASSTTAEILFKGTINSAQNLTITDANTVKFEKDIGVTNLEINTNTTYINGPQVFVTENQTYGFGTKTGNVVIGADTELLSGTDGTLYIKGSLNGSTANTETITIGSTGTPLKKVTFNGTIGDTTTLKDFTVYAGEGGITANNTVKVANNTNLTATGGDILFDTNATLTTAGSFDIIDAKAIIFNNTLTLGGATNIGSSANAIDTTVTFKEAVNSATENSNNLLIYSTENIVFREAVGTTKFDTITAITQKNIIFEKAVSTNDTLTLKASATLNEGVEFKGNVTAGTVTVQNSDVHIGGASIFTGTIDQLPQNLFIVAGSGNDVSFSSDLDVAQNIILFSGNVTLPDNTTAGADLVFLGTNYNSNYTGSPADIDGLFQYNTTLFTRPSNANAPTFVFPERTPSSASDNIPQETTPNFAGTLSNLGSKTITVGKNFYANGLNITGGTFEIPNNSSATSSFAEVYNGEIKDSNANTGFISAPEATDKTGNNANWAFARPELLDNDINKSKFENLSGTYTISDNIIRVEFKYSDGTPALIENTNDEISAAVDKIKFNTSGNYSGGYAFATAYTNPECTVSTNTVDDISIFYIKIGDDSHRWNTDAVRDDAGESQSTDTTGTHRTTIPNIHIPLALDSVYETLRDQYKNRIATVNYVDTADRCEPVLIAAYTGQEMHTDVSKSSNPSADQEKYDAHNFIEFVYSEEVTIGDSNLNIDYNESITNVQSTPTLGDNISTTGLEFAGLAKIASGKLSVGSTDASKPSVNALYRNFKLTANTEAPPVNQTHRVRLSIAGYVDGTTTVNSATHHNWIGYINSVVSPSGTVTPLVGVKDVSANTNAINTAITTTINNTIDTETLYSPWDVSPPVLAKFSTDQTSWMDTSSTQKEIIAYSTGGLTVQTIDFHFFDNTPQYTSTEPRWESGGKFDEDGWFENGTTRIPKSFVDNYGGSRFNTDANRTSGGLRYTSLINGYKGLEVKSTHGVDIDTNNFSQEVRNSFIYGDNTSYPSGYTKRPGGFDTPYISLTVTDPNISIKTDFEVTYDENITTPITDLAGNKMKTVLQGHATSIYFPYLIMSLAPVGTNELFVLFSSKMSTNELSEIPKNLELKFTDSTDLKIDETVPARVVVNTEKATGFVVTLNRDVTYTDITKQSKSGDTHTVLSPLEITGEGIKMDGNDLYARTTEFPLSTFAINVIKPLFAYDNRVLSDTGDSFGSSPFGDGVEYVARLFDGSGSTGNTVLGEQDIFFEFTAIPDGETTAIIDPISIHLGIDPTKASISTKYNSTTGQNSRVWTPEIVSVISDTANTNAVKKESILDNTKPLEIPVYSDYNWGSGDQFQFLFEFDGKTIDHDNDALTAPIPLYALTLKNTSDLASLDLWSLDIKDVIQQAGGVTILNNVINTNVKEKTRLEIDVQKAGNLTIQVMTIDGNNVKTLHRGRVSDGLHYYHWDGTNTAGNIVARGMYFIRIIGPEIDETRKVMAVRD